MTSCGATNVISLGLPEELEQIPSWHELHDDVDRVIIQTHAQYFDDVRMVEISARREGEKIHKRRMWSNRLFKTIINM